MTMNRAHLTPTTVTNKNGVRTTVYKKNTTEPASARTLPKVTLSTIRKNRKALEADAARVLFEYAPDIALLKNNPEDHKTLLRLMPRYSDDTLRRILAAPQELGPTLTKQLGIHLRNLSSDADLNDWITIQPASTNRKRNNDTEFIVNALGHYQHLTPQFNGYYPPERTAQVQALTRVTEHLDALGAGASFATNQNGQLMQVLDDEALSDLLTTHEDPSAIADIIIDRNLTDPDQIIELYTTMTQTNPALNEGTL